MIPYLTLFLVVLCLTFFAECFRKKQKKLSYFFAFLSIIILTLFATFRAYSVGTDINVYGLKIFNSALSFSNFQNFFSTVQNEHLYYVINYIISHIFGDFRFYLFFYHLFISIIVYKIAYKSKDNDARTGSKGDFIYKDFIYKIAYKSEENLINYILVFLLLVFNSTFNILRQSIAIFIILYSYHFLKEKNYLKYIIAVLIAQLFHSSAIMCLSFILIVFVSKSKYKYLYTILFALGMVFAMSSIDSISTTFNFNSFVSDKYMRYIISDKSNFNAKIFFVKMLMCFLTLFFSKFSNDEKYKELTLFPIIDLVLYSSSNWIVYGYRMSYYTLPFYILLIPKISSSLKNKESKFIYNFCIIGLMICYWVVRYYIYKYDGTMPFLFYWE